MRLKNNSPENRANDMKAKCLIRNIRESQLTQIKLLSLFTDDGIALWFKEMAEA